MKRVAISLLIVFSLLGVGCQSWFSTTPSSIFAINHVKLSQNDYYYYAARFKERCPSNDSTVCTDLKPQAVFLQGWYTAIEEAGTAVQRGGKLPLQETALKTYEKKASTVFKGW